MFFIFVIRILIIILIFLLIIIIILIGRHFILGDFNARLQERRTTEEDIMGTHVSGRGEAYRKMNEHTKENRHTFVTLAKRKINNTRFDKPGKDITLRKIGTREGKNAEYVEA